MRQRLGAMGAARKVSLHVDGRVDCEFISRVTSRCGGQSKLQLHEGDAMWQGATQSKVSTNRWKK